MDSKDFVAIIKGDAQTGMQWPLASVSVTSEYLRVSLTQTYLSL